LIQINEFRAGSRRRSRSDARKAASGMSAKTLRSQAALCRRLAGHLIDDPGKQVLLQLAEDYDAQAAALEGPSNGTSASGGLGGQPPIHFDDEMA
jgi:hypothetical protein